MYVYIHTSIYIYIHICVHIYISLYIYAPGARAAGRGRRGWGRGGGAKVTCARRRIYVDLYICIYIYVYIYIAGGGGGHLCAAEWEVACGEDKVGERAVGDAGGARRAEVELVGGEVDAVRHDAAVGQQAVRVEDGRVALAGVQRVHLRQRLALTG